MRSSRFLKSLALILAVLSLTAVVGSALGIWALADAGFYESDYKTQYEAAEKDACHTLAYRVVKRFASAYLGGCPEELIDTHYGSLYYPGLQPNKVTYTIQHQGDIIGETPGGANHHAPKHYSIFVTNCSFLLVLPDEELGKDPNAFVLYYGKHVIHGDYSYMDTVAVVCRYEEAPEYTVHIYLEEGALDEENQWTFWEILYAWMPYLPYILAGGGLIFILCAIYLCLAAGKKKGFDGIHAGGLNKIPMDLYLLIAIFAVFFFMPYGEHYLHTASRYYPLWVIPVVLVITLGCSAMFVAFAFALVAQLKSPDGFFYKNTLLYRCLRRIQQTAQWLIRAARAVCGLLPVIWQWLLTAAVLGLALWLTAWNAIRYSYFRIDDFSFFLFVLAVLVCAGVVCYGGWCFGLLIKGAKAMAQGDLGKKIPTKHLYGSFKVFAEDLNRLADAAYIAAQNQMRSERMKAELITNVSHDIKTPLTSIINFVDLLQKPHTDAEGQQYLEVLARQSTQMKRLIDDLMDLSKAATGNMTVSIAPLDAVEAVKQALGEFSDKLDAANLTPVFRHPEDTVTVNADGRLLWRVLNNLLSNIVKYALPGTRVYLELTETDSQAILSLKNISREELNITADALMERFVQGDASRNTEGSGLGLNIAQSLMQVQKGSLSLHLDGDLFKVTLSLPKT